MNVLYSLHLLFWSQVYNRSTLLRPHCTSSLIFGASAFYTKYFQYYIFVKTNHFVLCLKLCCVIRLYYRCCNNFKYVYLKLTNQLRNFYKLPLRVIKVFICRNIYSLCNFQFIFYNSCNICMYVFSSASDQLIFRNFQEIILSSVEVNYYRNIRNSTQAIYN